MAMKTIFFTSIVVLVKQIFEVLPTQTLLCYLPEAVKAVSEI